MADLYRTSEASSGMWGESDAPDNCIVCGTQWESSERLHTGDHKGVGGWEDWMYCAVCKNEWFFPVVRRASSAQGDSK